jgi:coenzyme F420-0:L-glutamate ligase/coenzyme F420-1:gamma-L-glutamate ligase
VTGPAITCLPVRGLSEVVAGDDLAALIASAVELHDGDVVVVTSKVVSKAEGRVVRGERADHLEAESDRVVARRGPTAIVRTHHGLVIAAAGIDASNTSPGTVVLLPVDPDASARRLREAIAGQVGPNVGVLVSDTSGRAWRNGQTDIAIGAAGVVPLDDHAGQVDAYGNLLAVTAPAVADEITGLAELATGKLGNAPAAVVRGLDRFVLDREDHGPGAAQLVRDEAHDMFGLGSREAVVQALLREEPRGFGAPCGVDELVGALGRVQPSAAAELDGSTLVVRLPDGAAGGDRGGERLETLAFALGWRAAAGPSGTESGTMLRFVPMTP